MSGFNKLILGRLYLLQIADYRLESFQKGRAKGIAACDSDPFRLAQSPPDGLCDFSVSIPILLRVIYLFGLKNEQFFAGSKNRRARF